MNLLDRIMERCVEEGDCLIWQGCLSTHLGYGNGRPCVRVMIDGQWKTRYVRNIIYEARNGPVPPGKMVYGSCTTPRCVGCAKAGTRTQMLAHRSSLGLTALTAGNRANISIAMRKAVGIEPETIASVREALRVGGKLQRHIAAEHGISIKSVQKIKRRVHDAIRGSSVFHQR